MGWTTRGKVNVTLNSAVVTGVGSLFLQDGRIGDGFRGPDGRIYEVTNIATNTGLTIQPPYEGPTVSNATYYLAPFEGYVKDTADALRAASLTIGQFPLTKQDKSENLTALSALAGTANRIPMFTGAGAMSLAAIAASIDDATAGRLLTVGYAGRNGGVAMVMGNGTVIGNLKGAMLYACNATYTDGPPWITGAVFVENDVHGTGAQGYAVQRVWSIVNPLLKGVRCRVSGVYTDWQRELFVGDFGIGSQAVPLISDYAADIKPGFYFSYGASHAQAPIGGPLGSGGGAVGIVALQGINNVGYKSFLAVSQSGGAGTLFIGSKVSAGAPAWNRAVTQESAILDPALNTGGVVFYGFNSNGMYAKHANGVLECWMYNSPSIDLTAATRQQLNWNFPATFVGTVPYVTSGGAGRLDGVIVPCTWQTYGQSLSACTAAVQRPDGLMINNIRDLAWYAKGRWK